MILRHKLQIQTNNLKKTRQKLLNIQEKYRIFAGFCLSILNDKIQCSWTFVSSVTKIPTFSASSLSGDTAWEG